MAELSHFAAEFFKTLSHPLRAKVLDALRSGEVGVNELSVRLKVLDDAPRVSNNHLIDLRDLLAQLSPMGDRSSP